MPPSIFDGRKLENREIIVQSEELIKKRMKISSPSHSEKYQESNEKTTSKRHSCGVTQLSKVRNLPVHLI